MDSRLARQTYRAAELLSSRCTSDAGHHPALQAGETAHQLALPGLHHWCTPVLSAPREDLQRGVLCTAHLARRNCHFLLVGDCQGIMPARADHLGTATNVYTERAQCRRGTTQHFYRPTPVGGQRAER